MSISKVCEQILDSDEFVDIVHEELNKLTNTDRKMIKNSQLSEYVLENRFFKEMLLTKVLEEIDLRDIENKIRYLRNE